MNDRALEEGLSAAAGVALNLVQRHQFAGQAMAAIMIANPKLDAETVGECAYIQADQMMKAGGLICGRIYSGHMCKQPKGSKCPDCGPACHYVPEGA
jgi:hypothetical protein